MSVCCSDPSSRLVTSDAIEETAGKAGGQHVLMGAPEELSIPDKCQCVFRERLHTQQQQQAPRAGGSHRNYRDSV